MTGKLYSELDIVSFRSLPKRATNPGAAWLLKPATHPGHRQRNLQVTGRDDPAMRFMVYQRQNLLDEGDFSCGIAYIPREGPRLTLARYNGPSHRHGEIAYRAHIHRATAAAIAAGKKPESDAAESDRFETLAGALACLVDDFNVDGLGPPLDM